MAAASASARNRCTSAVGGELAGEDHLEGDDAVEADLPGLVDDAHAAAGDLLQQLVVAEVANPCAGPRCRRRRSGSDRTSGSSLRLGRFDQLTQGPSQAIDRGAIGCQLGQLAGELWVLRQQFFQPRRDAALGGFQVGDQDGLQALVTRLAFGRPATWFTPCSIWQQRTARFFRHIFSARTGARAVS